MSVQNGSTTKGTFDPDTFEPHPFDPDGLDGVNLDEIRSVIRDRIAEVQELARDIPDAGSADLDEAGAWELGHVLANLNRARMHLSDVCGC